MTEDLTKRQRYFVEKYLAELQFVTWDRWVRLDSTDIVVYGWIDREDEYKDYVEVTFDLNKLKIPRYSTSSDEYSEKICKILYDDAGHTPCRRVENTFRIKNKVELKDGK